MCMDMGTGSVVASDQIFNVRVNTVIGIANVQSLQPIENSLEKQKSTYKVVLTLLTLWAYGRP